MCIVNYRKHERSIRGIQVLEDVEAVSENSINLK